MEALTRLVTESLVRHGFDRPLDYRRLQWSRWFRCESHHSLLFVPSKPGVFALAEEMMDLGTIQAEKGEHVETVASAVPRTLREAPGSGRVEERRFSASSSTLQTSGALAAEGSATTDGHRRNESARRMLAVAQFFDADDMAFVLDRMLSRQNPRHARLTSGRYFIRFVVIEDESQRRSICSALNQWIVNSTEKATGIGSHFASSLELTPQTEHTPNDGETGASSFPRTLSGAEGSGPLEERRFSTASSALHDQSALAADLSMTSASSAQTSTAPPIRSGAATNIHCPFPSGF